MRWTRFDTQVLLAAIGRFEFDAILLALNAADRHHRSFTEKLLPAAVEQEMAIIGMKIPARGLILSSWKPPTDKGALAPSELLPIRVRRRSTPATETSTPTSSFHEA